VLFAAVTVASHCPTSADPGNALQLPAKLRFVELFCLIAVAANADVESKLSVNANAPAARRMLLWKIRWILIKLD
jgi:hypothetical protein